MSETKVDELYDVIFFWDNTRDPNSYRQYCGETFCNIMGLTAPLSVKLVIEAEKTGRVLLYSTRNIDSATELRNVLSSLEISTKICPTFVSTNTKL